MTRSLEVEDAAPTTIVLMMLQRWVEQVVEKEVARITAKCQRYQDQGKPVPAWVRAGMDERFGRVEQVEQRVQMLLGIFASHGVLQLEFKPAYSVGELLLQQLDALEQEAEEKGESSRYWPSTSPRSTELASRLRHECSRRIESDIPVQTRAILRERFGDDFPCQVESDLSSCCCRTRRKALATLRERLDPLWGEIDRLSRLFFVTSKQVKANKYDLSASRYRIVDQEEMFYEDPQVTISRIMDLEHAIVEGMRRIGEQLAK